MAVTTPLVLFVPGARVYRPSRRRTEGHDRDNDVRVFRVLARRLQRSDNFDADDLLVFAYGGVDGRREGFLGFDAALRRPAPYGPLRTLGRVERQGDRFAAALQKLLAEHPGRDVLVVGYSIGGNVALLGLGQLPADAAARVRTVVTLASPLAGHDATELQRVFGPPMLHYAHPAVGAAAERLFPDLDVMDRVTRICERVPTNVLNVAVQGDIIASPRTALIGFPDSPPLGVDWHLIEPKRPPVPSFGYVPEIPAAIAAMGALHSEMIVRRDVVRTVTKHLLRHAEGTAL